jgi:two-component system, cell cycle response regulator CtrA
MRVLVSAREKLATVIRTLLVDASMVCDTIETGEDLQFGGLDYDCLVLDLDDIGLDPLRWVRAAEPALPIVTLSRQTRAIQALEAGADDFLAKPFAGRELVARVKTRILRAQGHAARAITVGPLRLDLDQRFAYLDGAKLPLTKHEYALVEALALRKGRIVEKGALLAQLYHIDDEPSIKIIDVFVCKIRGKLGAWGHLIQTAWGRGYALREPPAPVLAQAA